MGMAYRNCFVILLVLIGLCEAASRGQGNNLPSIRCYSCDSHSSGQDCNYSLQSDLSNRTIMSCSDFITDLNPSQLRCVRIISNTDVKEVIIRRCAVVGDCKYIAKNEKQSCFECAHDLCNDGK